MRQAQLSTRKMKLVNSCINNIQFWLFPASCVLCGAPGHNGVDLCPHCETDLPRISPACQCCGLPLTENEQARCGQCLQTPRPYQRTISPYYYQPPLIQLITQFKFNHRLVMARVFAYLLAKHIINDQHKPEAIIPVPLHPRRLRERGYNQSLEIARLLGKTLNIPVDYKLCQRTRYTLPQTGLTAKTRKQNVKDAFGLTGTCEYKHIAIVDDVITTGHTITELASLLHKNGVDEIEVWSVARAVPD